MYKLYSESYSNVNFKYVDLRSGIYVKLSIKHKVKSNKIGSKIRSRRFSCITHLIMGYILWRRKEIREYISISYRVILLQIKVSFFVLGEVQHVIIPILGIKFHRIYVVITIKITVNNDKIEHNLVNFEGVVKVFLWFTVGVLIGRDICIVVTHVEIYLNNFIDIIIKTSHYWHIFFRHAIHLVDSCAFHLLWSNILEAIISTKLKFIEIFI